MFAQKQTYFPQVGDLVGMKALVLGGYTHIGLVYRAVSGRETRAVRILWHDGSSSLVSEADTEATWLQLIS